MLLVELLCFSCYGTALGVFLNVCFLSLFVLAWIPLCLPLGFFLALVSWKWLHTEHQATAGCLQVEVCLFRMGKLFNKPFGFGQKQLKLGFARGIFIFSLAKGRSKGYFQGLSSKFEILVKLIG